MERLNQALEKAYRKGILSDKECIAVCVALRIASERLTEKDRFYYGSMPCDIIELLGKDSIQHA